MSVQITASHIVKRFDRGRITIIPDLSLTIRDGEFFTLLGPSGCGKTTFLRMIAGFNNLDGGNLYFGDRLINDVPVYNRNIGMVFQNYAIFPHMTVAQNVAYGLKLRKVRGEELTRRVNDILDVVKMREYADRHPDKLSGGQQQRIALARAIVIDPDVLLMDEPLSNLDAKLKIEMRGSIRELQKRVGITTVYVTHDQEEALAVSDRIAVISSGEIQQVDTPQNIYRRPANVFVATFIGHSNLLHGAIRLTGDGQKHVELAGCLLPLPELVDVSDGQRVIVSMRTDEFEYAENGIPVQINGGITLGRNIQYSVSFPDGLALPSEEENQLVESAKHAKRIHNPGETVRILPTIASVNIFTDDGKQSLIRGVSGYED